ncbi:hypothetical protein [Amylibacter sp. IMCC11727]|uniref:hypothetical protein n=1 Tax=Amylibacter sp. IMCC11727 TaxID=3039851 RepID=UPI00244DFE92|nr:hypothetical protein [Amylibacter sp. IMCC11727]WGI22423.1 hypothetical protein QBD29_03120 [Amylibacter sp. IMCC11727]
MSSEDNGRKTKSGIQAIIGEIAANAGEIASTERDNSLRDRIDSLELLVEEFGQARELQNELKEYVSDLKEEVADIRNYRFWVTTFAMVTSVSLFALLISCMVMKPEWFMNLTGQLKVSLIIALGGGSVFLTSLVLRGVYRSRHERNHGEMLPEAVRIALETMNK